MAALTREHWLAQRRSGLGSSDSPAIVGCGYAGQSAYGIWAEKCGLIESESHADAELLECGQVLQPAICELARRRTGYDVRPVPDWTVYRDGERPWLLASPDSLIHGDHRGLGICELKNVGGYRAHEWEGDEPPLAYHVQLTHQMLVCGATWGIVCGLVGGNRLVWHEVSINQQFADALLATLAEFWRLVETQTPPPVDGTVATAAALYRLHPDDDGTAVALPGDAQAWHAQRDEAARQIKFWEEQKSAADNLLKAAIGDHTWGVLPDGSAYSWKTQERAEYVAKASKFRVLRAGAKVPPAMLRGVVQPRLEQLT